MAHVFSFKMWIGHRSGSSKGVIERDSDCFLKCILIWKYIKIIFFLLFIFDISMLKKYIKKIIFTANKRGFYHLFLRYNALCIG